MSSEATPGYPAPLTACIVVTKIDSIPNIRCKGASATTNPMAEQLGLLTPALLLYERKVAGVDLWNDERNIFVHAKRAGVADHGTSGCGELRLQFAGDSGVEGCQDDAWRAFWRAIGHGHLAHALGNGRL